MSDESPVSGHERDPNARSRLTNAEVAELDAERQRLTALLHRWLLAASAMGGGPRAVLTQDTLDAVGMPDV